MKELGLEPQAGVSGEVFPEYSNRFLSGQRRRDLTRCQWPAANRSLWAMHESWWLPEQSQTLAARQDNEQSQVLEREKQPILHTDKEGGCQNSLQTCEGLPTNSVSYFALFSRCWEWNPGLCVCQANPVLCITITQTPILSVCVCGGG